MANDIKKKFTVDLEITTDNAEKQLKQTATNMKKMFAEIGSASDKIGYLREVVGYLEQVDAWLTKLQEQDPQAFKKALKSMDKDLAHGLANIFGTSKTDLQMLDQLATQINSIDTKSSTTEVKKLAKAVNELFKSVGQEPKLDIDGMFSGKADVKQKMKRQLALNKAFKEFIALWADASAKNIGNLMPGGASGGTGVTDAVATDNKELDKQVKKLQGIAAVYQETLAIFDGKKAGRKTTPQNDVATLKKLKESFEQASASVREFEAAGNTASNEYKQAVANAMRVATLFKNTRDYLFSSGSDKASQLATDYAPIAKQAQQYIENLKKSDIFKEVRVYVEQQIANINAKLQKLHSPDSGRITAPDGVVAAQQKRNEELASSYDELAVKVKEYIDVQKQLKTLEKGSQARKDALARAGQIQNDILSMKDLGDDQTESAYDIFEEINSEAISSTDAISKLCGVLQIDIPSGFSEMAESASSSFNVITKGANNASKAMQKVMYHLGNLLNGKGKKQDAFDEMPYNLTEAVEGNAKYEKYGFGVLGSGLFGVSDPSTIEPKGVVSSKFIHGVDLSKYNMYMADTEERASALMEFLSKLQKYAMKQAEPDYTGFDEQLDGVNMDTLYDQFKVVFNESDLTKEKLNNFVTDMVGLLRQAGLKFDTDSNELIFTSIGDLEGSENISTRLMKMLGYHGVNVGGTSFDGFGQGSVLFDFKESDLVSYFNNVEQAVDDFNKRINDANWDGTNEQLKQYRANIDDLIARLQAYEQKFQKPSITKNVNDTVAKLTQTKSVIDKLLSGDNDVSSGSLHRVTEIADNTYADKLAAAEDENKKLREKNAALQADNNILRAHVDASVSKDEHEALEASANELAKENEQLEHKLELLQDIATQYGISITKKDRDRYEELADKEMDVGLTSKEEDRQFELGEKIEEADAAMEELGETYDKIILKLANGKKVEILPDDKGLRALEKIANEYYEGEYNGQEIEDIIFVRKQEQEVVAQTNQQLDEQLQTQKQVEKVYNDIFDVLHNIGNQWKDLDTVDSAIGSITLSDIDTYVKELERLVKLIESVDPNFQYGDKNEYDGAVKTLEKLQTLSDRTKLTDEFKNTINQFEQLGKFKWSDELTNGYVKILEDIRSGTYKTIGQCVAKFNELSAEAEKPKLMDTTTAMKELVNYVSKSGLNPKMFFSNLEAGAISLNEELTNILQSLNLIGANGNVNLSALQAGFTNLGGFVSDQYTMIARPGYYLGKIQSIQPKLQQAQQEGAQIGAIFDIIEDKAKGIIYEIQNTVPGKSVLGHHSGKTNMDILTASEAHIEGLVNTLQILAKNGLFVDWGGDNVLYDPQKGFSIIDMGDKGDKHFTVSAQNTLQENLDRMVKEMFKFAPIGRQNAFQDFAKNLYASAQKIDHSVINPYAPKQARTVKDTQDASAQTAAAVQREEAAHEDNTAAINAENAALQAQIELKKKAQSMKWEAFATDDSLSALKQAAGMQTLGQLEGFWKTANYEKPINFHEITEAEAKQIFKDKLPKGLASAWYGSANFMAKSKLENEILADDEIRNAAMSYFWHIFKNSYTAKKYPNVKTYEDFIDTEFTMYRGDQAPLIYDPSSKLSFSINESTANGFNANLGTIKIKPKGTIGNAGSAFSSELETFAPSEQTSWFKKNREAFADFYNKQTKEMQKELDSGFVNFEKKRISDIIGDDLSTLTHKALQSSYWKHNVADDLKNGIVPDQITVPTDGSDYAQFATAYNGLTDTMKRFVMFFASMDELSASLPKPFSISVPTAGGGFKYGKNAVGAGAELFNAVLNDPEGRHQHIARLTGEKAFNLMGVTPAEINTVADAHERNAQAITAEAQAQKDLNSLQERYDMVMDDLWDSAVDADGSKHNDLSKLWSQLHDVQHSDQDLVNQGLYTQKSTGQSVDATDLFQLVVDIESKYNENLDYVKDYLTQVYSGIDFEGMIPQPTSAYENTKTKTYETAKSAYKSGNQREYFKILGVLNHLNDVEAADVDDIARAQYTDTDTGRKYDVSKLLGMVKSIEDAYGENFDYVYDYLKQVYGEATIDDALSNLDKNGQGTTRRVAQQYTVADYEAAYAASPADMQAAIDDLAVFQQRYEQLYALTNTQPIDIMFPGKPTLNEVDEVMAAFDEFKSKQRQIFQLQMLDYDGNKEKIQELQAEAVGLQNKLRDASLGENADISEYKLTYGFTDDQDAERFKNLVDMTESVHTVINDLTRIGEHKMSLIPQEMQDMLDSDDGGAAERFMAIHAQQVQSAKAAAQQADASAAASKQRLQTEQDITTEKQRQNALDDQHTAQSVADTTQAQNVQAETTAMNDLLLKINAVEQAVKAKTAAFEAEGVAVDEVVNKEISALTQLKTLLDNIQNTLQIVFASNSYTLGDIDATQDKASSNSLPNVLQAIQSTLEQIYSVLKGFTGLEADNKNSVKRKEPVVENNVVDSDAYKLIASKMPEDVATESTLAAIKGAVDQLAKSPDEAKDTDLTKLVDVLTTAVAELKSVANGIVQHQKTAKSDTSVANARISNKNSYAQIRDVALNSLGNKALESEVTEMKALANGIVQVTGWLKVAEDAWEGFTVQINEANEASKLAFSTNSKAAKQAAAQAKALQQSVDGDDDANVKLYDRAETEARAKAKIDKYTSDGKIATVQFKDSGRYTITTLEKIGGLTKQVFQTFDENDTMIERTTATMSNAALAKIQGLQKIAQFGFENDLIGDGDKLYQDFQRASQELEAMNFMYSQAGQLSDDQITNWQLQIDLVTKLGKEVQKVVAARKNPVLNEMFAAKQQKQSAAFNTEYAKLQETIAIPDSFMQRINDAGEAIKNAVNNSELQVAQNNWAALRKEIELTAMQQNLYIKKSVTSGGMKKNAYGATPLVNAQAKFNTLSSRAQPYMDAGSGIVSDVYGKYEKSLKRLIALQNKLQNEPAISDAQKVQFTELKNECNEYYKELKKIIDASEKFASNAENSGQVMGDINVDDARSRSDALKEYVQEVYGAKATIQGFNSDMTELKFTLKNTDGTITNMTAAFNAAKTHIGSLRGETKKTTGVLDLFAGKTKELWTYMIARVGVDEAIQAIRTGIQYVRDIDSALTDLKKVTDETDASYDRFLQNMSKTASTVGSTVSELTTMAAEWARLNI